LTLWSGKPIRLYGRGGGGTQRRRPSGKSGRGGRPCRIRLLAHAFSTGEMNRRGGRRGISKAETNERKVLSEVTRTRFKESRKSYKREGEKKGAGKKHQIYPAYIVS